MRTQLSKNLSVKEVIKSNTASRLGLDNTPTEEHLDNLVLVAENIFQPLREHFDKPIGVSSGYRGEELNKAINGSKSSDHCQGRALDLDADIFGDLTNAEIFNYIKDNLEYDQLIWEFGDREEPNWVHVSYREGHNRNMRLRAYRNAERKTRYARI